MCVTYRIGNLKHLNSLQNLFCSKEVVGLQVKTQVEKRKIVYITGSLMFLQNLHFSYVTFFLPGIYEHDEQVLYVEN